MSVSSVGREKQSLPARTLDLEAILARISAGASARDAHPSFPEDPFVRLAPTGALAIPVPDSIGSQGRRASFAEEWRVLRAVAGADGSVGRILDGHFNGAERVSLLAPEPLRSTELEAITAGKLFLGVWGADPRRGRTGSAGARRG
jgi:alkylation response protein AidB-like acyl-CoA dehydrogenase